ncbi:nucleotidyltransferase domain-containing protein [Terrabacter terrigena]|uniref:DNA polymerase beta superfamily protein n=1 Tax=Terrabacter terrigena TaxID=574718 RepID=A0ABW3MSK1_9MICO
MRRLTHDLDPDVVRQIDARLAGVAEEHRVAVPWAIESGSRAWGFPSPDSDYDCRFFFVRPRDDYLDPWPPRDVIETPLDPVLDVNGWDLVKAVRLVANGNATVSEWLRSPIVYSGDADFRDALQVVCDSLLDLQLVGRHYLHVGEGQWARSGAPDGGDVVLKRVFYALRPAAALHWMAVHGSATPPMNLGDLFAAASPPAQVVEAVDRMVAAKAVTRELGTGRVDPAVAEWVTGQFAEAAERYDQPASTRSARREAAAAFRDLVEAWSPR